MTNRYTLFEISWEVCNKVGGIHTVLSSKARTQVERLGDDYITVGPWLLSDTESEVPFEEDPAFADFAESCRQMGIPVRVGRWKIAAAPRTILVEFSGLYGAKDDILAGLWEEFEVDSIAGAWDYVEPVLFGHAAGRVIERWWEERLVPERRRAVVQAHEWMTASALLYLKSRVPAVGTMFTTHATMLGRALSSTGISPDDGLGDQTAAELAEFHGVKAKHSLEGVCARNADTFATVSEITAKEAELLHGRAPDPVTPNGIDLEVLEGLAGGTPREEVRATLHQLASRFLGEDVQDAAFLAISGRYEFHNKGFDVLLEALAQVNEREGRRVVLFVLAPAGNTGVRAEYLQRRDGDPTDADGPLGISTHNLFDPEQDPVHQHCAKLGFDNAPDSRVRVIQVPIYLSETDGFLNLTYEAVLAAMDLTCFPSYYEPWGYTPQESLGLGVPTITTDYAGFGRWAQNQGLGRESGITVLSRVHVNHHEICEALAEELEGFLAGEQSVDELRAACRATAARTSWTDFISNYDTAYAHALECVEERMRRGVQVLRRYKKSIPIEPARSGERPRLFPFEVSATLPAKLVGLSRLARNYWWCWDPDAPSLFEELSPRSWEACGHDPVLFLRRVYPEDLKARAEDADYVARLERVLARLDAYTNQPPDEARWLAELGPGGERPSWERPVAYFCAEFGLHESLPIYSGGLGILAGDHLKSASDLGLPLVAIGLFYRNGYMSQRLSPAGEQIEEDVTNDPSQLAMERVRTEGGEPLELTVQLPGRKLYLRAWRVEVGRVPLYLLDTDTPSNRAEDRDITRHLYGGGSEMRLQQEIVLGRGGVRLMRALGMSPAAYHMNEGHAAFLTLERVRTLTHELGLTFEEAEEHVRATTLFTTHTPVPAGHDRFDEDLIRRHFSDAPEWLGIPWERFWKLGLEGGQSDQGDQFNMSNLAMRFSSFRNGVSELHGIASRRLFRGYWPTLLEQEVPITSITNGIHLPSWTHPDLAAVAGAKDRPVEPKDFEKPLSDRALREWWKVKSGLRRELLEQVRERTRRSFLERGDSPLLLQRTLDGVTEDALLIGFARRFAPYKRATLLLQDLERLGDILDSEERPVRIFIAGKAHPRDQMGKDLVRAIVEHTRRDELAGRIFFLENYDFDLARHLMHGVDVWLNNPTRMLEASGTSGMKAAANGALNLSIGDGWWPEAFDGTNGWLIGEDRAYEAQALQDEHDGAVLYRLLEEEVVPLFFERDGKGLPMAWLKRVARSLETIPPVFNTDRMVLDYARLAYRSLAAQAEDLSHERRRALRSLVGERARVRRGFEGIRILSATVGDLESVRVGDAVEVSAEVELGALGPEDVRVELVVGHSGNGAEIENPTIAELSLAESRDGARHVFRGAHRIERSGSFAYGIRLRARLASKDGAAPSELVRWA